MTRRGRPLDEAARKEWINRFGAQYKFLNPTPAIQRMGDHASEVAKDFGESYVTTITKLIGLLIADEEDANPELPKTGWSIDANQAIEAAKRLHAKQAQDHMPDSPMLSAASAATLRVNELVTKNGGHFGTARLLACLLDFDAGAARLLRELGEDPAEWTKRLLKFTGDVD